MEKANEISQDRTTINNQAIRYKGSQWEKPLKNQNLQEEKEQLSGSTNVISKMKQRKAKGKQKMIQSCRTRDRKREAMAVKMKGWNDQIWKGLKKLDILGQIREVVQDQTEDSWRNPHTKTAAGTTCAWTDCMLCKKHGDRLQAKTSGDRGGRKASKDSRAGEHREKLTQVSIYCL